MKIISISDTHGYHGVLSLENCDILIHAGDFSMRAKTIEEIEKFLVWYSAQPARHKIFIAGNHDFAFQNLPAEEIANLFEKYSVEYLEESGCEIEGVKFWGSPWTPFFYNWAFNIPPGTEEDCWSKIPDDTDILITHGPPLGYLDNVKGELTGCKVLLKKIENIKPRMHIFGHIHEGGSAFVEKTWEDGKKTIFVNACICNPKYLPINKPITLDYVK